MRKELLVFVSTAEQGEEISVTSVAKNRSFVLISTPNGKVTANREELVEALAAIKEFDESNNTETTSVTPSIPTFEEVEYGQGD